MSLEANEMVYRHAVNALAANRLPDYATFEPGVVARAFVAVFDGFTPKADWLEDFKRRVLRASGFLVRLEEADISEFRERVKGPAAYLALVHGRERKRVRLVPGVTTPFTVDQ